MLPKWEAQCETLPRFYKEGKHMSKTFEFITDPGHGWLRVSRADIDAIGLRPENFSEYSYRDGNTFYLEEDCDAATFINRYILTNEYPTFRETYQERTFIRNLPRNR